MAGTRKELIYAHECYKIIGVVYEVFNEIGSGHKENIYQKALAQGFKSHGIPFEEQRRVKIKFKNEEVGLYILDFFVFDKIVLELKKRNFFSKKDIEQLFFYLKATGLKLGLIIHFTQSGVRYKRVVNLM